jgi:hypothetical protein
MEILDAEARGIEPPAAGSVAALSAEYHSLDLLRTVTSAQTVVVEMVV